VEGTSAWIGIDVTEVGASVTSAWMGIDVTEVGASVSLLVVGVTTWISDLGVMGSCGNDCEANPKSHGTAILFRCTLSAVVKSLSEKCLLHKHLLCSIPAESIVQDIPTFPAHTRAL
jgi:hypothetical protein